MPSTHASLETLFGQLFSYSDTMDALNDFVDAPTSVTYIPMLAGLKLFLAGVKTNPGMSMVRLVLSLPGGRRAYDSANDNTTNPTQMNTFTNFSNNTIGANTSGQRYAQAAINQEGYIHETKYSFVFLTTTDYVARRYGTRQHPKGLIVFSIPIT